MAVGRHMTKADWDNVAYNLFQAYDSLMGQAAAAQELVAPFDAAALAAKAGYSVQEATDLISGVNVLAALRSLSRRFPAAVDAAEAATATQTLQALGKFGGA